MRLLSAVLIGCALACARLTAQDVAVPRMTTYVTDLAGVLSAEQRYDIESDLRAHEDTTSNQIVVLTVPTTGNLPIEEYAIKVFEENGIGTRSNSNGVLLLVAVEDRKVRIEVGYGLEGAVTDALSSLIINNAITPRFKTADYAGGIKAGVSDIMKAAAGEYHAEPRASEQASEGISFGTIIFAIVFLFIIGRMFRGGGGRRGGGGGFGGSLPWIIMSRGFGGGGGGGFGGGGGGGFG
ncbi:MAG: TPM domain-containing protein, partial [bacterium]|nr:TPM domain-containing protein [Candidatus Kapabacteria bacterium]